MTEVLSHEIDFLRALRLELLRFAYQSCERLRAMLATHQRDGAEGARMVAAFRDLQIPHVRLIAEELPDTGVGGDRIGDQSPFSERRNEMV